MKKLRTISEVRSWLSDPVTGENTIFGSYLVSLDRSDKDSHEFNAATHLIEIGFQVFAQLEQNGFDLDKDSISIGSFGKAYYQVKLEEYKKYK